MSIRIYELSKIKVHLKAIACVLSDKLYQQQQVSIQLREFQQAIVNQTSLKVLDQLNIIVQIRIVLPFEVFRIIFLSDLQTRVFYSNYMICLVQIICGQPVFSYYGSHLSFFLNLFISHWFRYKNFFSKHYECYHLFMFQIYFQSMGYHYQMIQVKYDQYVKLYKPLHFKNICPNPNYSYSFYGFCVIFLVQSQSWFLKDFISFMIQTISFYFLIQ